MRLLQVVGLGGELVGEGVVVGEERGGGDGACVGDE